MEGGVQQRVNKGNQRGLRNKLFSEEDGKSTFAGFCGLLVFWTFVGLIIVVR